MVYQGKPSRGCGMCKKRRIKCDEGRPTCNQCAKSKRDCPGYVDEFDLVFRNETAATEKRARKAMNKALAVKTGRDSASIAKPSPSSAKSFKHALSLQTSFSSATSSPIQQSPVDGQLSRRGSIAQSPNLPLLEQASHHFISNFVLIPPQGTERGYLEYLLPIIDGKPHTHFQLAFEAVSLASLGTRVGGGAQIEKQALGKYTAALAAISSAIRDPILSKEDDTVAAVLLLGLFENITSRHLGMLAWGSHTEGAIQLIKSRGADQLLTKQGRDIFVTVRTQQMIYAFSTGKAPYMGADYWTRNATKDFYGTKCQNITLRISELKTEVNRLLMTLNRDEKGIEMIMQMIKKCQERDRECIQWSKNLPKYFQCKSVAWESSVPNGDYARSEIFPGRLDAFQDIWVASVWSTLRCSRIVLASLIVRAAAWICAPVDYRTTPEYAAYSRIGTELVTDLVASIPYQLGWFAKRKELLDRVDLTSFCCGEDDAPKGLAGYFVTWPLSCILTQDYSTDDQRTWVRGRLHYVADVLGVRYAKMLTQLNLRVPSMLIQRDATVSGGNDMSSSDFEKILSTRMVPPSGLSINPLQKHDLAEREQLERQQRDLYEKAMDASGSEAEDKAQQWSQLNQNKEALSIRVRSNEADMGKGKGRAY